MFRCGWSKESIASAGLWNEHDQDFLWSDIALSWRDIACALCGEHLLSECADLGGGWSERWIGWRIDFDLIGLRILDPFDSWIFSDEHERHFWIHQQTQLEFVDERAVVED